MLKKILPLVALLVASYASAQNTYTLGPDACSGQFDCYSVPMTGGSAGPNYTVEVALEPVTDPTSTRGIWRIPEFLADNGWAEVNNDSTYQVTYYSSITYTTPDGLVWIADIPAGQTVPGCIKGKEPCHSHQLVSGVQFTFTEVDVNPITHVTYFPPNPHTGTGEIYFGAYRYSDSTRGAGWYGSLLDGSLTVN